MVVVERVRTDVVAIHSFAHSPGDARVACEWWSRSCVAFTTYGSWQVRSVRGRAEVHTNTALIGDGGTDYDCRHTDTMDDRALCVTYLVDVESGPALVIPLNTRLHAIRRSILAELRRGEPDRTAIDELSLDLLASTRRVPGSSGRPSPATRAVIEQLRGEADAYYTDGSLDLVAAAAVCGMSRTRFVHHFRELVGVTPHRYLVELRTTHAARLLAQTAMPVTEICFASGFGSIARFHAAFRAAFDTTPTAYRARNADG